MIDRIALLTGAWSPSLCPDGSRVAYVSDRSGLPRLVIAGLDGSGPVTVSPPEQEIVSVAWSPPGPDGEWLAYLVSPAGTIRSELHAVRPDGSQAHLVAGGGGTETVFAGAWTSEPGRYAFSVADGTGADVRDADVRDADVRIGDVGVGDVRVGQPAGRPARILASGGFLALTSVSRDGRFVLARRGERGRRHLVIVDTVTGETRRLIPADLPGGVPIDGEDGRFAADGSRAYLRTSAGAEFTVLAAVALAADGTPGELTVLAARDGADLDSYAVLPDGLRAVCVWNVQGRSRLELVDLTEGRALGGIKLPGDVVTGWSLRGDGTGMVLSLSGPTLPRTLWTVSLEGDEPPALLPASAPTAEEADVLTRCVLPSLHRFPGRDGLELDGWLYRPEGAAGPGPAVLTFHGGPESQDRPAYSPVAQSLVAAGFTVFAPNVRGSSGYGRTFLGLDDGPARLAAVDDARAAALFLVEAGYAEAGRLGAHGWSYGGFLTLVALERWPELFAAGCAVAGMSDLRTFMATTEPWMAAVSVTEYGDPVADAGLLAALSPMSRVERIVAPTLLVHGDRDTNVPVAESQQLFAALQAAAVPSELLVLRGEGHAIVGAPGRLMLAQKVTGWFRQWL